MRKTVVIDCFPESVKRYRQGYAVIAIDVIRATTTAITAVAMGRRCFVVPSQEAAWLLSRKLSNPLLVGELGGIMPAGFDMNNSPTEISLRKDIFRPAILLSSSGTKLIHEASECKVTYLACFRNHASLSAHLDGRYNRIAIIGAGSKGQFREEDQMCCAWIAEQLVIAGYEPENNATREIVERWSGASSDACLRGKSADYLRRSGQTHDLEFVTAHLNDIHDLFAMRGDEVVMISNSSLIEARLGVATSMDYKAGIG